MEPFRRDDSRSDAETASPDVPHDARCDVDLARWADEAQALPAGAVFRPVYGIGVYLREIEAAARFVTHYWPPAADRPGLAAVAERLGEGLADELHGLARAVLACDGDARLYTGPDSSSKPLRAAARALLGELEAACAFCLQGRDDPRLSRALAGARARAGRARTLSEQAQGLVDFATLGTELGEALRGVGFPPARLAEAHRLSEALLQPPRRQRRQALIAQRNRLLTLAQTRLATLRTAVAFVFREHPDIVRAASARQLRG